MVQDWVIGLEVIGLGLVHLRNGLTEGVKKNTENLIECLGVTDVIVQKIITTKRIKILITSKELKDSSITPNISPVQASAHKLCLLQEVS